MITVKGLDPDMARALQDICEGVFLDGECYAFAIMLHRELGWPMIGLMDDNVIRHVVTQTPAGTWFDARGPVKETELGQPFGLSRPYNLRAVEEKDLRVIRPVHEASIARARDITERLGPDLPWKNASMERAKAFAREFEDLCKKHGIWLRSSVPDQPPLLVIAQGDETGFALTLYVNGAICSIDRTLD